MTEVFKKNSNIPASTSLIMRYETCICENFNSYIFTKYNQKSISLCNKIIS